jgi:hypothetical protein
MLTTLLVVSALATQLVPSERTIGPLAVDRVESIDLEAGHAVVVQPLGPATLALHVEVYDSARVLMARDDEDVDAEAFEWAAPVRGRYYLLVRNSSNVQGTYRLRLVTSSDARRVPPASQPDHSVVRVFYGTNRVRAPDAATGVAFADEPTSDGGVTLGTVDVSVPRDHR